MSDNNGWVTAEPAIEVIAKALDRVTNERDVARAALDRVQALIDELSCEHDGYEHLRARITRAINGGPPL